MFFFFFETLQNLQILNFSIFPGSIGGKLYKSSVVQLIISF